MKSRHNSFLNLSQDATLKNRNTMESSVLRETMDISLQLSMNLALRVLKFIFLIVCQREFYDQTLNLAINLLFVTYKLSQITNKIWFLEAVLKRVPSFTETYFIFYDYFIFLMSYLLLLVRSNCVNLFLVYYKLLELLKHIVQLVW